MYKFICSISNSKAAAIRMRINTTHTTELDLTFHRTARQPKLQTKKKNEKIEKSEFIRETRAPLRFRKKERKN